MAEFDFLLNIDLFKKSLTEQQAVVGQFWSKARLCLEGSGIRLKPLPESWTGLRYNHFSVLFITIFFVLNIPLDRLRLYARINHCLRAWVTACDNLLDNELKEMIVTDLPERARTFKSVHTLLVTDRIFFSFLLDAVRDKIISPEDLLRLIADSLSSISASGREEAEEEGGVDRKLTPENVLENVHTAKTGRLFTSPLSAPLVLGDLDPGDAKVNDVRQGLMAFGLGCQVLDDLSDVGMDLCDDKHNYLVSLVHHGEAPEERERLQALISRSADPLMRNDFQLYRMFPKASQKALAVATSQLQTALERLSRAGLPLTALNRESFIKVLIRVFRHPNRLLNLRGR